MHLTSKSINCGHSAHSYKKYILCSFDNKDSIIKKAIAIGKSRATKVNPKDPSGRTRSTSQLESTNIRGVLAELCTELIFQNHIQKRGVTASFYQSNELIDDFEGKTQVDLYLTINNNKYEIETRSSCVRNGIDFGITQGYFNIIGWYKTSSKPNEPKKDFYLMYLYGFDESETLPRFDNKVEIGFVGGASKSMLQGTLGSDITMKQNGASYRGINPICAGKDSEEILDEIFS